MKRKKKKYSDFIFAFDTSAILDVYRFPSKTANQYLDALEQIQEVIWIPGHVYFEFGKKNRESAKETSNQLKSKLQAKMTSLTGDVKKELDKDKRVFEEHDKTELLQKIEKKVKECNKEIEEHFNENFSKEKSEEIDKRIDAIILGRVGTQLSTKDKIRLSIEAHQRYKVKFPPGYNDMYDKEKKDWKKYSDYLIWTQILEFVRNNKKDMVFVTGELGEDWWNIQGNKRKIREELLDEIREIDTVDFRMFTTLNFIKELNKQFDITVKEETIAAVKKIEKLDTEKILKNSRMNLDIATVFMGVSDNIDSLNKIFKTAKKILDSSKFVERDRRRLRNRLFEKYIESHDRLMGRT